jgi:hypothetical protein
MAGKGMKVKHFLRVLIAVIFFIPCAAVSFILGGIGSVIGTEFHEKFNDFISRLWRNSAK